jgi:nitrous oxide reductase
MFAVAIQQLPQVHRIHGLEQVKIEARRARAPTVFVASEAGERYQPDSSQLGHLASAARQFTAIHARKSEVDEHQIRNVRGSEPERRRAVSSDAHVVPE